MSVINLNMDFSKKLIIDIDAMTWAQSPREGVLRKRLEVEEAESNRATSIVKYAAGSSFHSHTHTGGEEFLVLEGTFSDETGDYKAGTYVRNPPGSSHTPFSKEGCVIFVKLHQMAPTDKADVAIEVSQLPVLAGNSAGHSVSVLYQSDNKTNDEHYEKVQIEQLNAGAYLDVPASVNGYELLLLEGDLNTNNHAISSLSWVRLPDGLAARFYSKNGCKFWSKQGHLPST